MTLDVGFEVSNDPHQPCALCLQLAGFFFFFFFEICELSLLPCLCSAILVSKHLELYP
jgi:hypothetical protein